MQGNPRLSWLLDSTPWISGFQVLDSSFFLLELGFRVPVVGGIPDSKDQGFVFHKRNFPDFRYRKQNFPYGFITGGGL